jgi:hypothetical protein
MKSALFVDFDNVFTQLRQVSADAADRFARHPTEWIQWLADSLPLPDPHEEGEQRRLLVRRCYLNPNWYQNFRHAFLRAGFEVVDCPPVTSQGKTSTDIHMVLDIVELLQHDTRYDEFIVFSADADFTPVLRKLRRFDRRTTVLAIGYPSAAYQASADLLIDEREFIGKVLAEKSAPVEPEGIRAVGPTEKSSDAPTNGTAAVEPIGIAPALVVQPPQRLMTEAELSHAAETILKSIAESPRFLAGGFLASRLKQDYPFLMNWNGQGNFKTFFKSLRIARLVWFSGSGGRLLDPATQYIRSEMTLDADSSWAGHEDMFDVIAEVCGLTGAPMFSPHELALVLNCLAEDVAEHPFELASTAGRVLDRCKAKDGLRVRRRDVTFLLRGMLMTGHVFGEGNDGLVTLKEQLTKQVLFLCEREQMPLNEQATAHIRGWIGGKLEQRTSRNE